MKTNPVKQLALRLAAGGFLAGCVALTLPTTVPAQTPQAQSAFELELLGIARQSERFGNLTEASRLYQQVLTINPNSQEAHHRLGVMAAARGEMDRAISHFNTASTCGPPSAQMMGDYGGALFLKGDIDQAEQKLKAALMLDPENRVVKNNLELVSVKVRERAAIAMRQMAEQRAQEESQAAERAHRLALARAAEENRAAVEALAKARAASAAREIAEARAAAENQAAAKALADARNSVRARELAEAKALTARQEAEAAARQQAAAMEAPLPTPLPRMRVQEPPQERQVEEPVPTPSPRMRVKEPHQERHAEAPAPPPAARVRTVQEPAPQPKPVEVPKQERRELFAPPPVPASYEAPPGRSTLVLRAPETRSEGRTQPSQRQATPPPRPAQKSSLLDIYERLTPDLLKDDEPSDSQPAVRSASSSRRE